MENLNCKVILMSEFVCALGESCCPQVTSTVVIRPWIQHFSLQLNLLRLFGLFGASLRKILWIGFGALMRTVFIEQYFAVLMDVSSSAIIYKVVSEGSELNWQFRAKLDFYLIFKRIPRCRAAGMKGITIQLRIDLLTWFDLNAAAFRMPRSFQRDAPPPFHWVDRVQSVPVSISFSLSRHSAKE